LRGLKKEEVQRRLLIIERTKEARDLKKIIECAKAGRLLKKIINDLK
jgi:hypothetical protein